LEYVKEIKEFLKILARNNIFNFDKKNKKF